MSVVDGDTIVIDRGQGEERLRYIGIDTPESVKPDVPVQFMAREASDANAALVDGREVVLEKDVSEVDRYDRLLRYVWLHDGDRWLMVNEELVRGGFAKAVTYRPDVRYTRVLQAAQREAQAAHIGLWSKPAASSSVGMPRSLVGSAIAATAAPSAGSGGGSRDGCDPAYPDVCIAPPPPDLDCADIPYRRFAVLPPDPHHFDGGGDGIGCENG